MTLLNTSFCSDLRLLPVQLGTHFFCSFLQLDFERCPVSPKSVTSGQTVPIFSFLNNNNNRELLSIVVFYSGMLVALKTGFFLKKNVNVFLAGGKVFYFLKSCPIFPRAVECSCCLVVEIVFDRKTAPVSSRDSDLGAILRWFCDIDMSLNWNLPIW